VSLLFKRDLGDTPNQLIPPRTRSIGSVTVGQTSALRTSGVWACVMLRANLVSMLDLKARRRVGDVEVDVPPPPFIMNPGGDRYGVRDWLFSSQTALDRYGNVIGIISATDSLGNPSVVELVGNDEVTLLGRGAQITGWRIGGKLYTPDQIWHERQYTIPGVPLGLSPIANAAMSIGNYMSAQKFATDWFTGNFVPAAELTNVAKTIDPTEATIAKERFRASVADRDVFVHGSDWKLDLMQVAANESQFLETMDAGLADIARFLGVPSDMIDVPSKSKGTVTYANITQRNLQLLIMHLNPMLKRREYALSSALPKPRFVEFDRSQLLEMDPASFSSMLGQQVEARLKAPSEGRADLGLPPFTADQLAEFTTLFPAKAAQPSTGQPIGVPA
jgi:HK97 family phage portal protein